MRFFLLILVVSVSTSIPRPLSQSFINQNGEITQNDFISLNEDVTQDRVDSDLKIAAEQPGSSGARGKPRLIITPSGVRIFYYPDGTVMERNPGGGEATITYPDGSITTRTADGVITTDWPDGKTLTEQPDGTITVEFPDGSISVRTIDPSGKVTVRTTTTTTTTTTSVSTQDPDGTVTVKYPDGKTVVKDPKGKITVTDANGKDITPMKWDPDNNSNSALIVLAEALGALAASKVSEIFDLVVSGFEQPLKLYCALNGGCR